MSDLFDHMNDQMGDDDDKRTVTPLDLINLPDEQRQVLFSFLRDAKETFGILTLNDLQEKHHDLDDLLGILDDLTNSKWLIQLGRKTNIKYKANLGRRRGSQLSDDIWASLSELLAEDSAPDSNDVN